MTKTYFESGETRSPIKLPRTENEKRVLMGSLAQAGFIEVEFTKKSDGTVRNLVGTLHEDYLPSTKGIGVSKGNSIFTIYDVEKEGWRSFDIENLTRLWVRTDNDLWKKLHEHMEQRERDRLRDMTDGPNAV